jgi:hypothetical protein
MSSSKLFSEKSPHVGSIFLKNLVFLNPYTGKAPETKMTDPTERRIKKMSDKREADNN